MPSGSTGTVSEIVLSIAGEAQPLANLSAGQRMMLALAADLAIKAVTQNAHLLPPDELGPEDTPLPRVLALTPGVVLIDELDVHLHPKWQRHVAADLKRTFPNLQFVCTSHSPQVIGELARDEVMDLRGEGDRPAPIAYGEDSNWILDHVMDASSRAAPARQIIREAEDALDEGDFPKARTALDRLGGCWAARTANWSVWRVACTRWRHWPVRTITKRNEPQSYVEWRAPRVAANAAPGMVCNYEELRRHPEIITAVETWAAGRTGLHLRLHRARIAPGSFHVEHLKPQTHCAYGEDADYKNLVACWPRPGYRPEPAYGARKRSLAFTRGDAPVCVSSLASVRTAVHLRSAGRNHGDPIPMIRRPTRPSSDSAWHRHAHCVPQGRPSAERWLRDPSRSD